MILTNLTDDEIVKYRKEISHLAYDIEWDNNFEITLSPLLKNIDKFNCWLEAMPFYMNVQKEGVILNECKDIKELVKHRLEQAKESLEETAEQIATAEESIKLVGDYIEEA